MSKNIQQNDITNAMLESVQLLADHSAQTKEATLVVEAEIVEVVDEGLGTYVVKYLNNKFNATTAHTEITYKVGDNVYIVIPNGDFDKNKVILSPVVPSTATYATTENTTKYVSIGDNLFKSVSDVELCTYKPHDANPSGADPSPIVNVDTTGFSALFQAALKDSRIFNFTCKIQTNIDKSRRSRGNYGLVLDIPVLQSVNGESKTKYYSIVMDVNNITGDPYQLLVPALQNFYFSLPKDMEYNEKIQPRIRSFVTGFIGEDNSKPNDIFIIDIKLLSTMEVDQENLSGYYSVITATGGNSFLPSRPDTKDVKTLSVTLYLNGKKTNLKDFDCYWFKENIGIDNTSDKFQKFGGLGWEILNDVSKKYTSEDGKESYVYVTDAFTQSVSKTEIHCDTKFKCVLVKVNSKLDEIMAAVSDPSLSAEDRLTKIEELQNQYNEVVETIVSSTITIRNLNSTAVLELTPVDGSPLFPIGIGDVKLQLKYKELGVTDVTRPNYLINYYWQRLDKQGNIIAFDENIYKIDEFNVKKDNAFYTKLHYPVSEIDETNTIGCTAYIETIKDNKVARQIIGTVWLTISTGHIIGSRIVVTNGDKLYKYDADGDSPMVADYDGPLSSAIKTIDPISIKIFKEDGSEFTTNEYMVTTIDWLVPINSMINLASNQKTDINTNPGYYTIRDKYPNNKELTYSINPTFNKNKLDNTIIIKASAPESILKETITNVANLKFLKDGEGGTNGTKYSAIVTYIEGTNEEYGYGERDSKGKIHKLQLIYVEKTGKWYLYNPAKPPKESKDYVVFNNPAQLKVKLYADGEFISSSASGVQWRIFDNDYYYDEDKIYTPVQINGEGKVSLIPNITWNRNSEIQKNYCATVEARVSASRTGVGGSITNSEEYIYAYYPIECTYVPNFDILGACAPTIEGGFSKVLYASDGTSPQYDNSENFYVVDPLHDNDIEDLYDYSWQTSTNMTVSPDTKNTSRCRIIPRSKYDNSIAKNFVRVQLGRSKAKTDSIRENLNQANNNRLKEENDKQYYIELQNNLPVFQEFKYDYYKQRLYDCSFFLRSKQTLYEAAKKMLSDALALRDQIKKTNLKNSDLFKNLKEVLEKLTELNSLYSQLGFNEDIYNEIIEIKPSSLILNNKELCDRLKVLLTLDGNKDYPTFSAINYNIEIYNDFVNSVYNFYYSDFQNEKNLRYDNYLQEVFEDLKTYVHDERFENLTKAYVGVEKEAYRFNFIKDALKEIYDQLYSYDTTDYSLSNILDNIIEKIQKDYISPYISFSYETTINTIKENIHKLEGQIDDYEQMLKPENSVYIIHVKPIIMIYNRYELSNINGWDGNKLKTNDGYLLAPQVGAGKKNKDNNTFTGIVMGVKQISEKTTVGNQKIGLFGYSSGVQSIFLNAENGSATFGVSGAGQIIIESGEKTGKAIIKSGNYNIDGSETFVRKFEVSGNPRGLYEYNAATNQYQSTTDSSAIPGKDYYERITTGRGMQIDLTTPEIRFGTGNFVVNSAGHITAAGGGSIAGWDINDTTIQSKTDSTKPEAKMVIYSGAIFSNKYDNFGNKVYTVNPDSPGKIYTGQHNTLDSEFKGFYLSSEGLSITGTYEYTDDKGKKQTATSRIELNTKEDPVIFTGRHGKLGSTDPGFYLGSEGLSIGTSFTIKASGKANINHEESNIGQWRVIKDKNDNNKIKLVSSTDGIYLDAVNSRIILGSGTNGEIYSGSHLEIGNTSTGFYLSDEGLSIGSSIRISSADNGKILIGRLTNKGKRWTINGDTTNAYIAYNTTEINKKANSVYLGTDGISLGKDDKFIVTNEGALTSKSGTIGGWTITEDTLNSSGITISSKGSIAANYTENSSGWCIDKDGNAYFNKIYASTSGTIGGWTISSSSLSCSNNEAKITIDANGSISGGQGTTNWSINNQGHANFNHVTITGVQRGSSFGGMGFNDNGITYGVFSGDSTYDSTNGTPFGDGCQTHIKSLAVAEVIAKKADIGYLIASDITAELIKTKIANADLGTINSLTVSSTLTVSGTTQLNSNVQLNGTLSMGESGKITALENYATKIEAAKAGEYSGTCTVNGMQGTCTITINAIKSNDN